MKKLTTLAGVCLLAASLAAPVWAQYGGGSSGGSNSGGSSSSGATMTAGSSSQNSPGSEIRGTVTSVDQTSRTITYTDSSGNQQTMSVSSADDLKDIKSGDKVKITAGQDGSTASKVKKDR
jgi:hypothetical protein